MSEAGTNICLIGGAGYLGSSFRSLYSSEFSKCLILGRRNNSDKLNISEEYQSTENLNTDQVAELLRMHEINTVIDFAYNSVPKTSFENPIEDFSANLLLVNKHLEVVKRLKGCKYIYISSGGTVYGNVGKYPLNELQQNFPISPYGITKMACERYVKMYQHVYNLDVVIVRPSNIYGPGQKPFAGQGFIATAMGSANLCQSLNVFGDGANIRDYLYIDDFCAALFDILKFGKNGEIYNVGSSDGKALNEIIKNIVQTIAYANKRLNINYLPPRRFDVEYNVLDNAKVSALNEWKIKTSLQTGLANTWNWLVDYMGS